METPFARLDAAKQRKILDAAMAEFAQHGYEQASTNRIVTGAGISKGLLFHYFGNKEGLYQHLVDAAIDFANRLAAEMDTGVADPIERWGRAARLKFAHMLERPHVFDFLTRVYVHELDRLPPKARQRIDDAMQAAKARMFAGIDATLVRDDIDPESAYKIIQWSIEGFRQQVIEQLRNTPPSAIDSGPYWDEFHALLAALRKVLYRQEEDDAGDRRAHAQRDENVR